MKKALRISCILILAVLILTANTAFSVAEGQAEAVDMGELLTIQDEKHDAYVNRLRDKAYNTRVSYTSGDTVSVYGSSEIGYAYFAWQKLPAKVSVAWLDGNKNIVSAADHVPARLDECVPVPQADVCGFQLTFSQACALSELTAYTQGQLPKEMPQFEAHLKKPAVMLITGYPGDELACFGGLLPSLVSQGVPVQVVYLNPYNRERQEECLRTLWRMGMRNEPIFLDTAGIRSLDSTVLKSTMEKNGEVSKKLLAVIENCAPSVIVTHGKTRHFPLMSESEMTNAVVSGLQDRLKHMSSLKKIYYVVDKGASNGEVQDFSGGYDRAVALFEEGYASLRTFHYTPYGDDTYTLHYANGNKFKDGDMLANISYTALDTPAPETTPTPEPTVEPTAEPTSAPTEEPVPVATPEAAPVTEVKIATETPVVTEAPAAVAAVVPSTPVPTPMPRTAETRVVLRPILMALALAAVLFVAMIVLKKAVRTKLPVIVGILVPILAGAVLCVGLYVAASINERQAAAAEHFDGMIAEEAAAHRTVVPTSTPAPTSTEAPTAEPTPAPTAAPTAEPTPEPTAKPTPAPTATPDPDEGLYTNGEEYLVMDADQGRWIYKNKTLSMEVTRYTGTAAKMEFPYYVADIHMRANEFRAGFGHEQRSGTGKDDAMSIAKRYRSVLMITGDNLIHMDKDKKGILIRDGWVYQDSNKGDLMIWHPETLSIELVPKEKIISAQLLQEGGVENCISFGPILIHDGAKTGTKTLENNWLYKTNPRVGVGMVEPGHFIVIVGGYRSDYPKANLGWNLVEFTELMASYGCTEAYNMDGGVSACIVFMGERLNKGGNKKDWSQLRTLPDGLLFGYSDKVKR